MLHLNSRLNRKLETLCTEGTEGIDDSVKKCVPVVPVGVSVQSPDTDSVISKRHCIDQSKLCLIITFAESFLNKQVEKHKDKHPVPQQQWIHSLWHSFNDEMTSPACTPHPPTSCMIMEQWNAGRHDVNSTCTFHYFTSSGTSPFSLPPQKHAELQMTLKKLWNYLRHYSTQKTYCEYDGAL